MPVLEGGNIIPTNGLERPILKAGVFNANDFAGQVSRGGLGIDTANGQLYQCTATNGTTTSTWVKVGAQV